MSIRAQAGERCLKTNSTDKQCSQCEMLLELVVYLITAPCILNLREHGFQTLLLFNILETFSVTKSVSLIWLCFTSSSLTFLEHDFYYIWKKNI